MTEGIRLSDGPYKVHGDGNYVVEDEKELGGQQQYKNALEKLSYTKTCKFQSNQIFIVMMSCLLLQTTKRSSRHSPVNFV